MKLTTTTTKNSDQITVNWATNAHQGTYYVENTLNATVDDEKAIAELAVIKYLIFEMEIFNHFAVDNVNCEFCVSQGVIKKLLSNHSNKTHLKIYTQFFRTLVSHKITTHKKSLIGGVTALTIENSHALPPLPTKMKSNNLGGEVVMTVRAMERFAERSEHQLANPWKTIYKHVSNKNFKQISLPNKVKKHKLNKYGPNENMQVWGVAGNVMKFVVLIKDNITTIVTAFNNEQPFRS
jgi:hypothetical protein